MLFLSSLDTSNYHISSNALDWQNIGIRFKFFILTVIFLLMDCAVTSNISIEIKPKEEKKEDSFLDLPIFKGV